MTAPICCCGIADAIEVRIVSQSSSLGGFADVANELDWLAEVKHVAGHVRLLRTVLQRYLDYSDDLEIFCHADDPKPQVERA
ncbi:hypothetical protein [Novosphingobium malaysiense]|uniref:hypothetical protein n=1 Tax=Novosphingobium malaysiense TaxID=1348853 RepID=UPI0012E0BB34|nr:hypothetical protein [Novosphingobium malaysiense]